jgi:hypothetical protein
MDVHAINLCRVCCGGHECFSLAADAWLCLSYLPARQVSALMCARASPSAPRVTFDFYRIISETDKGVAFEVT